jgi:hypothetical protein
MGSKAVHIVPLLVVRCLKTLVLTHLLRPQGRTLRVPTALLLKCQLLRTVDPILKARDLGIAVLTAPVLKVLRDPAPKALSVRIPFLKAPDHTTTTVVPTAPVPKPGGPPWPAIAHKALPGTALDLPLMATVPSPPTWAWAQTRGCPLEAIPRRPRVALLSLILRHTHRQRS